MSNSRSPIRFLTLRRRERTDEAREEASEHVREPETGPEVVVEPEPEPAPALALAPPPHHEYVPGPGPVPEPEPVAAVVPLALRDATPRVWNLWELERLARQLNGDPAAREERTLILLHLRQFADPSGDLPVEFDSLVRDAFGADLAALPR